MEEGEATVREVWSRWNEGDRELDPDLFDPEFEVHSQLAQDVYRGPEGVGRWISEIDEQFDDWRITIDGVRALDGGRLLVSGMVHGRGRNSGIDLEELAAWIVGFREGRMLSIRNFIGRDAISRAADAS